MKKTALGTTVIYFPASHDRQSRENGATQLAAIVSNVLPGDDNNLVDLRVFSHSTDGKVLLRQAVPHKDEVQGGVRPFYQLIDEVNSVDENTSISSVSSSTNEEGVGPTTAPAAGLVNKDGSGDTKEEGEETKDNTAPNDTEKSLNNGEATTGAEGTAPAESSQAESTVDNEKTASDKQTEGEQKPE